MNKYKNKTRLANMLLDALCELKKTRLQHIQSKFEEFNCKCTEAAKDSHLFYEAVNRGWFRSAEKIKTRVNRNIIDFSYHLQRFKDLINTDETKLPKLSDIFAELSQIDQDVGEYQFDLKENTISVITESISLDDITFGPFEIKLLIDHVDKLYTETPYGVIALEPNPAGADSSVTHPHVSSETLCEGDGHVAIRKALEQGRFCDFFTMIVNILQTYNPDSPYISLDDWEGISCYDCGYTVSGDECYYCEYCDRDYCAQCSTCCQMCDTTICMGCAYACPSCNEPVCRECTAKCKDCDETFCKDCLTENGICKDCEEQRKDNQDEEQKEESTEPKTGAAVQSDSVGQTAVHA